MKKSLYIIGGIAVLLMGYGFWGAPSFGAPLVYDAQNFFANAFLSRAVTEYDLKEAYKEAEEGVGKVRVLIVPGHTPESPGALYRGYPERNLTIKTGLILENYFKNDGHFQVFITQNVDGYTEEFKNYFETEENAINEFVREKKNLMSSLVRGGVVNTNQTVDHVTVSSQVATELYGINKWANENDIDIVLHLHFNDYPGRYRDSFPQHTGFSLYVPEKQYSNFKASRSIASHIFESLSAYYPASDLPLEEDIIIEDQELIAVGAFNTLESAMTLIEYGYLYEPQFVYKETQLPVLQDLAYQTYRALTYYFKDETEAHTLPTTTLLPYMWDENLKKGDKGREDILALQVYLTEQGLYPPEGKSKNDCPVSGIFGSCTENALKAFQDLYAIEPALGYFGPKTREVFNNRLE